MYNPASKKAAEFICDEEIRATLSDSAKLAKDPGAVQSILQKAGDYKGLTHREAAVLLQAQAADWEGIFALAKQVKEKIYGKRIVLFAPLYLSDYCVNNCKYCGYKCTNATPRTRLTQREIQEEIRALEKLGHKRLLLEAGEDDENCPIEYILESIKTIYDMKYENGAIRRVNVDIAATTVENYRKLKEAGIGTYILFQECYHKPTYYEMHRGPKHDYAWHTEAMDRAMEGGIEDVGIGPLFGLYDYAYETVATLMHAEHLEAVFGVGPHTISFPRLLAAPGVDYNAFPHLVNDETIKKIVAVLRISVPYTGLILSTRENSGLRNELLSVGASQMSAGSSVGVGGYAKPQGEGQAQFHLSDHRTPTDVLKGLVQDGYIPSYCTACYREGRTGDRFMALAKSGEIANCCLPNALLTFEEYLNDYADTELAAMGKALIDRELQTIPDPKTRTTAAEYLQNIRQGQRDLRF